MTTKDNNNIVVFDMDQTLGHFDQISIFWFALKAFFLNRYRMQLDDRHFFNLLDIFNIILRPSILNILVYLKNKKKAGICKNVMIYTNNQDKQWSELIKNYFNYKLQYKLFDIVIAGFQYNGKKIEICRTTSEKTINDLFRCTELPKNSNILFIDDIYHPKMKNKNVKYLHIKPYIYDIPFNMMIEYFYELNKSYIKDKDYYTMYMNRYLSRYNYNNVKLLTHEEFKKDNNVSQEIFKSVKEFFKTY